VRRRLQATIARKGVTEPLAIAVVPGIRGLNTETDIAQILATITAVSEVFRKMGVDGVGMIIFDTWASL
jgi:putative effector of murein hydrolase